MISLVPSGVQRTTDTHDVDVQYRGGEPNAAGYHLSTGSTVSTINFLSSGGRHHWDGHTSRVDSQSRQSLPLSLPSAAHAPTNARAELLTQPPSEKQRNDLDLPLLPTFSRIRRLLDPSGNRLPPTRKAVRIAPAQCVEQIVVGGRSRRTNSSFSPGEYIPFPDDGQDMITTRKDEAKGCCSFFG
ncbi:hypothetical protein EDC04DRAFT_1216222 [Pisolithus marmoratus]|nr:hypothetical protein EDC04DRAFT_1216222 [Pisolithus marmoratus]